MNEQNTLNISSEIKPQIRYRGSVKILYIDKNSGKARMIKNHNSGGIGLFTCICRALIGMDSSKHMPSYIYAYTDNTDINQQQHATNQVLAQKITYASTPLLYKGDELATDYDNADCVEYTFMIPSTSIMITDADIKSLVLYNNLNQICAILNLPDEESISTSTGYNILIYWKLKFISDEELSNS